MGTKNNMKVDNIQQLMLLHMRRNC